MKVVEFKQRVRLAVERLINAYYADNTLIDKFTNSTLKVLLQQNIDKLDDMLALFTDEKGEINAEQVVKTYAEQIGENGMPFDLRNYVSSNVIRNVLPNKSLIIKKGDIMRIIE